MHIKIAERLRPFSHLPGTYALLPETPWRLRAFPTRIEVDDLSDATPRRLATICWDIAGPLEDFTVLQDLEQRSVRVWGKSKAGYIRYALRNRSGIRIEVEKAPEQGIPFTIETQWKVEGISPVKQGGELTISRPDQQDFCPMSIDRLSLGSHKAQDWELICRRFDFTEIFPLWHRLGQLVPESKGSTSLLEECREAVQAKSPEKILTHFRDLFLASFDNMLSPRLEDTDFHGIRHENFGAVPPQLLAEGAKLIRSLFIQEKPNAIHLLPALPPDFHCGRLLDVVCGKEGKLSLEWTKKDMRRFTFVADQDQQLAFTFLRDKKTCRLRHSYKDKGRRYVSGTHLDVVAGQSYWFDNFTR